MYKLSVGAIFKDEEWAIDEWMQHYLVRGVDHFYLINDGSTDTSVEKLKKYMDKITLFHIIYPYYPNRQSDIYNLYILPHLKETEWLLMVDLDEFVWSPRSISLVDVLKDCHVGQIQIRQVPFIPDENQESIVSCTRKDKAYPTTEAWKYFVNSKYEFSSLYIHYAKFKDEKYENINHYINVNPDWFILNHYSYQSREVWRKKIERGDADMFRVRRMEDFDERLQIEAEIDTGLVDQNRRFSDNF